jgi:SNF2 family DNA or RNA helicase
VLPFLPAKVYIQRDLEMTTAQKKQYTQLKKGMMAELVSGGFVIASNALVKATRLGQIASACLDEGENPDEYQMTMPSNKIDALLELLDDMRDKPLVVASASRQLIELAKTALDKRKVTYSEVVGGQTDDQRDKAVQDFQAGKVRVIFCSTGAGSEGLTLTKADTMCFLQRPWKMAQSKQMEDRIHRIGAEVHSSITIVDLISSNTIEERILRVLAEKGDNLEEIMRDTDFIKYLLEGEGSE